MEDKKNYTPQEIAEMICLYHRQWNRIATVTNPYARVTKVKIKDNAEYLLRTGISKLEETIPDGVLKELGINLINLRELCEPHCKYEGFL